MGNRRMQVLAALTRLRQAACHPGMLPGGTPEDASGKMDRLLELLPRLAESGHRALVFSQWTSLLDLLEPRLEGAGLPFLRLDGLEVASCSASPIDLERPREEVRRGNQQEREFGSHQDHSATDHHPDNIPIRTA